MTDLVFLDAFKPKLSVEDVDFLFGRKKEGDLEWSLSVNAAGEEIRRSASGSIALRSGRIYLVTGNTAVHLAKCKEHYGFPRPEKKGFFLHPELIRCRSPSNYDFPHIGKHLEGVA